MSNTEEIMEAQRDQAEDMARDQKFYRDLKSNPAFAWMEEFVRLCLRGILNLSTIPPEARHGFTTLFHPHVHAEKADTTILMANGRMVDMGEGQEEMEVPFLMLTQSPAVGQRELMETSFGHITEQIRASIERWTDLHGPYTFIQILIASYLVSIFTKSGLMYLVESEVPAEPTPRARHHFVFRDQDQTLEYTVDFVLDDLLEPKD